MALAIHFPEHDIESPDNGDDVRHQVPANHFVERFQIDQ
jgi:hypothetical protein